MIEKIDIESLGWEHFATARDGGTNFFKKTSTQENFVLTSHCDNFIYKKSNHKDLYRITIEKLVYTTRERCLSEYRYIELYSDIPEDKNDLKRIMIKLKIDLKEIRKEKLNQINESNLS